MFAQSAAFYDDLYSFMDYEAAVREITAVLDAQAPRAPACSTSPAERDATSSSCVSATRSKGVDINPTMLEVARERCPGVSFHEADMADFSLEGRFDVVMCLFSSIGYVRTEARLRRAILACVATWLREGCS